MHTCGAGKREEGLYFRGLRVFGGGKDSKQPDAKKGKEPMRRHALRKIKPTSTLGVVFKASLSFKGKEGERGLEGRAVTLYRWKEQSLGKRVAGGLREFVTVATTGS